MPENLKKYYSSEDKTPFKDRLVESDLNPYVRLVKLEELENNPSYIIRRRSLKKIAKAFDVKDEMEAVIKAKQCFEELQKKYNIPVPVNFVVGEDEAGEKALYILTDRIEGKKLTDLTRDDPEKEKIAKEIRDLYGRLMQYMIDKFKNREDFLWDIGKAEQYVYGSKLNSSEHHVYLVDTDVDIGPKGLGFIPDFLVYTLKSIDDLETEFGEKFTEAREHFKVFIKSLTRKDLDFTLNHLKRGEVPIEKFINVKSL